MRVTQACMAGIPQMLLQVYALLDMYLNPNQAGSLKVIQLDPAVIHMLSFFRRLRSC